MSDVASFFVIYTIDPPGENPYSSDKSATKIWEELYLSYELAYNAVEEYIGTVNAAFKERDDYEEDDNLPGIMDNEDEWTEVPYADPTHDNTPVAVLTDAADDIQSRIYIQRVYLST